MMFAQADLSGVKRGWCVPSMNNEANDVQIWVDADACPNPVKEILFRASSRVQIRITLVANAALKTPPSPLVTAIQVEQGFDVADNYIAQHVARGDLVITSDIPLAAEVIEKDGAVISPRGEKFTKNNIRQRLTMRDFMEEMRSSGEHIGGPKPFSHVDRQQFGNALDAWLAKNMGHR